MHKKIIIIFVILFIITQLVGCTENHIEEVKPDKNKVNKDLNNCIQIPCSDKYDLTYIFNNPLNISNKNPGPGNTISLDSCIKYCSDNISCECRDWIQSIYLSFNVDNQKNISNFNGIWLPTICTVRDAVKKIPILKNIGINTVSFGPDIDTRHLDKPMIIGGNLFRFYIKLFEDAGFNVHLVPNAMHWGNNDASLYELNDIILNWAEEADSLNTKFYAILNEVDGMQENISDSSIWLQEVLSEVKNIYNGIVCVQPTQSGFESELIDYSGFDCVSSFFPLMTADDSRNSRNFDKFKSVAYNIKRDFSSVKYIIFNDVHTFSGGNWAETSLIEDQIKYGDIYVTESQQKLILHRYLEEIYPYVNGSFFNNYKGFTFIGREAEDIIKDYFIEDDVIEITNKDYIWNTTGLVELIENVILEDIESQLIFDLEEYSGETAGWAGLCFQPTSENPGPFNCTSVESCMDLFKKYPKDYWNWVVDNCFD